jgi:hypothetical protein
MCGPEPVSILWQNKWNSCSATDVWWRPINKNTCSGTDEWWRPINEWNTFSATNVWWRPILSLNYRVFIHRQKNQPKYTTVGDTPTVFNLQHVLVHLAIIKEVSQNKLWIIKDLTLCAITKQQSCKCKTYKSDMKFKSYIQIWNYVFKNCKF